MSNKKRIIDFGNSTFMPINQNFTCAKFTPEHYELMHYLSKHQYQLYYEATGNTDTPTVLTLSKNGTNLAATEPAKSLQEFKSYVDYKFRKPHLLKVFKRAALQDLTTLMTNEELQNFKLDNVGDVIAYVTETVESENATTSN